mmetsp:Transcript_7969/g.15885  ORF Transcript_7969/g.15885 Transcript_7969/m.15885 type:complete len:492 (-) Transcript_7969:39-1514(-)
MMKRTGRRRKKKKSGDVAPTVEDVKEEEDLKEKKEDGEEVEDVRLVGVKDVEKKEKVKLDVNPLKNKTRAQIMEDKDPDDVVDNYDFGYEVDGDDVEARRAQFKKEAKLTKDMLDARQPVDDAGAGRTDDLMNLFVEGDEESSEEEDDEEIGPDGLAGGENKANEDDKDAAKKEDEQKKPKEEVRVEKSKEEIAKEAADLSAQAEADVQDIKSDAPEPKPQWKDPSTGKVVDVDKRKEYLRKSSAYRECWDAVLARCVQELGKTELEKRITKVSMATAKHATPSMAFCALAECNGVAEHAIVKLQLEGYREEMKLAEEVCDVAQYVRVSKSPKKDVAKGKAAPPKGESPKKKRRRERSQNSPKGKQKGEEESFWRDPISGEVMDAEARKQHLLNNPSYKSCWEEVLGKLVQSAVKGDIEKNLARICSVVKVAPEIAFCSLAECSGVVQHAIVKLRHPGYVEEMKIAVEVCNVAQYVRVQPKKSKSKSPKKK